MTVYVSLGAGDVSLTRTLRGTTAEMQAELTALLTRVLVMAEAAELAGRP